MATPRCPYCNAQGLGNLAMERLQGQVGLFYCNSCGAIHGVAPLRVESHPKYRVIPAQYGDLNVADLIDVLTRLTGQRSINLTSNQIEQMFRGAAIAVDPPQCTQHGPVMILLVVPFGFSRSGQRFWICRHYRACHQWQIATPPPKSPPPPPLVLTKTEPPSPKITETVGPIEQVEQSLIETLVFLDPSIEALEELGEIDLSHKLPYDPEAIANRMKAAGLNQGSRYLHIAIDDGPPLCTQHKIEMVKAAIPGDCKNAGREVWLCPQFKSCRQWELAK